MYDITPEKTNKAIAQLIMIESVFSRIILIKVIEIVVLAQKKISYS